MAKRIVSTCTVFAAMLVASVALMFATALPAVALDSNALVTAQPQSTATDNPLQAAKKKTIYADNYVYNDGDKFFLGKGASQIFDISGLRSYYYSDAENWKMKIVSTSGSGKVTYSKVKGYPDFYTFKGVKSGNVTVTCKETWTEEEYSYDYDTGDYEYIPVKHSEKHTFVIRVVSLKKSNGVVSKLIANPSSSPYYSESKKFTFKIAGVQSDTSVEMVSDSNKNGYSYLSSTGKNKVVLNVSGVGTHVIKMKIYGKTVTVKAIMRALTLEKTADVKETGGLTTYPGATTTLKVKVSGVKSPKATWSSTDTKIATVNKKGVVKAKKKGRCYVKAKVNGVTLKVLVEVTSPSAYQAVRNALYDLRAHIKYSQATRMSAGYRDCSSFVSRCYWDGTQGRYILAIGGEGAKTWAATAAGQAWWLAQYKTTVSWGPCAVKKLRPGDTIYYKTGYAGKNTEWLSIDHAAMYVGNGRVVQTHSGSGTGDVGISSYWPQDKSIIIICRPCP